jgi:hypothetical protein
MTLHNLRHGEAVASNAAELLQTVGLLEPSREGLTSENIYYLLAACYLYDIGIRLLQKDKNRSEGLNWVYSSMRLPGDITT